MTKKTLLCLSLGMAVAGGVQAQTYYVSQNFNNVTSPSLPSGWASNPSGQWKSGVPNNIISPIATDGVSFNDPAHMSAVAIDGHNASANQSILELPSFSIPSGATNATIVYDICYYQLYRLNNPSQVESMELVVSTNGGSSWTSVQTITGNHYSPWETHTINVGSYAGQNNLIFGFRYGNTGAQLVGAALDNIMALIPGANDIALISAAPHQGDPSSYAAVGGSVHITGTVMNMGTNAISSYTIHYQQGNNTPVSTTVNGSVASFATGNFSNVSFTVPSVGNFPLKVWATVPNDNYHANDSSSAFAQGVAFMPTKRLVFEEATGTWCGWCPRGAVGMDQLSSQFPGAATQIAVHDYDPMTVSAYDSYINTFISGYPSIVLDRRIVGDPGNIISMYNQHSSDFGYATVTVGTANVSGNSVSIPVTIHPAVDINNAKLALVVTESNVRHIDQSNPPNSLDTAWMQHNYYSPEMNGGPNYGGNITAPLTGFDHADQYVNGMYYHFVARAVSPAPAGGVITGIPANMTAGSTYNGTLTATLDPSWNTANLQYDALLLGSDGSVLNSAATATPTLTPILQDTIGPNAIANVKMGINKMEVFPNPVVSNMANVSLAMTKVATITISIADISGKIVYRSTQQLNAGNNTLQIPVGNLSNGNYFMTGASKEGNATIKFVIER